jgi:hypothetical protein
VFLRCLFCQLTCGKNSGPDLARNQKTALILAIMSTLVVHPKDTTTDFLKPIYAPIKDKTVITGGITKIELRELIKSHHRVIMLGHGTPNGLMAVGQFYTTDFYIIDESMVDLLSKKKENIYIWCHASDFMLMNQLFGFGSGMFISEVEEAFYYDFWDVPQNLINESNNQFASITSQYINYPLNDLYENVIHEYGKLAKTNPIAQFNLEKLYFSISNNVLQT